MMQLLRSVLFTLLLFVAVLVYAPFIALCGVLPFPTRYRLVERWVGFVMWMTRTICGIDYEVEARDRLPAAPYVIYLKHSSVWETLAQIEIFPMQAWVLKRELMWVPALGWGLSVMRPIAIDRRARHSAVQQVVKQGRERIADGMCVSIFPEGTRMAPGCTRRYGLSGALLASEVGCPVVPVAHNAGDYWPRRSLYKKRGTIKVVIGPAIETRGKTPQQINAEARQWIDETMARISPAHHPLEQITESGTEVSLGQ